MNEIPHLGFKYSYPKAEWLSVDLNNNWFINFESNMVYIRTISKIYSITFIEENNKIFVILDDNRNKPREISDEIYEAYSSYMADKILLKELNE
jgi:hypothetical protein